MAKMFEIFELAEMVEICSLLNISEFSFVLIIVEISLVFFGGWGGVGEGGGEIIKNFQNGVKMIPVGKE